MRIASSIACCLAVVLMERVASLAARSSAPTASTPGSPCKNRRSDASDDAISWSRSDDAGFAAVVVTPRGYLPR